MIVSQIKKTEKSKIRLINLISFLTGLSLAVIIYVMSYYFKLASGTENVGFFYTATFILVLILLINLHKLVKKWGKSRIFFFTLLAKIGILSGLTLIEPSYWSIALLGLYLVFNFLTWTMMDVILESFSQDHLSGRIRGLYLTILNLGILFGPFISAKILATAGFKGIFIFILIVNALIFVLALTGLRNVNHQFSQKLGVKDLLKKVLKRKDILNIYYVSFVLEFFYALMIIYTPLYLLNLGFSWEKIGLIFTFMLIPFVIIQYPAGILADKKIGEKELIIAAILMMAISTGIVYFTHSQSLFIWSLLLFVTRIGAALVEILRDSYFYKRISGRDVDLINFFRTSLPLAYIASTFLSGLVLIFLPIKSAFLIVAIVVLSALYPAWKLVDNPCEEELKKKL
ncbi:MFS transporter [Patescibacteria group bacterium]|nr:MFS transporter [Patescibacteria group bacterium]